MEYASCLVHRRMPFFFYVNSPHKGQILNPTCLIKIPICAPPSGCLGLHFTQLTLHIPGCCKLPSIPPHLTSCGRLSHRLLQKLHPTETQEAFSGTQLPCPTWQPLQSRQQKTSVKLQASVGRSLNSQGTLRNMHRAPVALPCPPRGPSDSRAMGPTLLVEDFMNFCKNDCLPPTPIELSMLFCLSLWAAKSMLWTEDQRALRKIYFNFTHF